MSTTYFILAITSGLIVILALAWVISRQLKLDKKRKSEELEAEEIVSQGRQKRIESIQILLKVVGSEDLGWMETCIRIKNLLDQLSIDLSGHETIGVFYKVYAQTEHIPTHEGWSDLPKDARKKFKIELIKCEAKYLGELEQAKVALLAYPLT